MANEKRESRFKTCLLFQIKTIVATLMPPAKKYYLVPLRINMISMTNIKAYMIYMSIFLFLIMPLYFCLHSSEQSVSEMGIALPHI